MKDSLHVQIQVRQPFLLFYGRKDAQWEVQANDAWPQAELQAVLGDICCLACLVLEE
jgi:lipopolysaccharide export system protein LptC